MSVIETSDALDLTKENIRPLKQGRKPIQLETALQAQSNTEIQHMLNKEKEKYEHAIRTYEGDDPLAPHFDYIKWLEQIYLKHGPESNLLLLLEETVQKFKDNSKYKQDPRFIQILINFIENQSNAVELYQIVHNQGLGTKCALFYRAWADLLDRYNDFKRVDQIFMLGIQSKAEPVEELEQAHVQFQLSIARRMLNGQLPNDDGKVVETDKRHAFKVLKKSETFSGLRRGLSGFAGKVPLTNNNNGKTSEIKVFEECDENGLVGIDYNNCAELVPKGLNKENTVEPGPWTKPKKNRSKVLKPVSTVNFKVHQDNVECVSKLSGITVPNALRNIKGSNNISCPVAIFEPSDPTKKPMYCKDKVYAAGRDVQIEEIRCELFLKQEQEKLSNNHLCTSTKSLSKENKVQPLKSVLLPDNDFKAPLPLRTEPDPLSQSVTVNTRVAIDLVQQMWNSPCADKESELLTNDIKPVFFDGFKEDYNIGVKNPPVFEVYEDNKPSIENKNDLQQKETVKNIPEFCVYTDEDDEANYLPEPNVNNNMKKMGNSELCIARNDENMCRSSHIPEVYIDNQEEKEFKIRDIYVDIYDRKTKKETTEPFSNIKQVYCTEDSTNPINENKSPFKKIQNIEVNDDDITCSTKAFAFLLSSSTPLAPGGSKSRSITGNQPQSQVLVEEKENNEIEELPVVKNLSMILEASKERNSSSLTSNNTKLEQLSAIELGDSINPFDQKLISKLLQKVVKFPDSRHLSGYIEHATDVPHMRSEFKLGHTKMTFLGEIGKGSYARIVKAKLNDKSALERALKIQKPACYWEWYIGKEIQHRLQNSEMLSYFINMDQMHLFKNGSIISMKYAAHGTLLSVVAAYKEAWNRPIPVSVAALFALQMTSAVKYLHQCQIIHGDLKPDNVVIKSLPNEFSIEQSCVQLIDFGRSIDMTLFPSGTTFNHSVETVDFICHEMRENLPWTYQTDYFGLAGIIYMVLMSDYMKTKKIRKMWVLWNPFHRYVDKDFWESIMTVLLNIKSCQCQPDLNEIISKLKKFLSVQQNVVLNNHLTSLKDVLKKNSMRKQ